MHNRCTKFNKISRPFGKKCQKTVGGFFLTHTVYHTCNHTFLNFSNANTYKQYKQDLSQRDEWLPVVQVTDMMLSLAMADTAADLRHITATSVYHHHHHHNISI